MSNAAETQAQQPLTEQPTSMTDSEWEAYLSEQSEKANSDDGGDNTKAGDDTISGGSGDNQEGKQEHTNTDKQESAQPAPILVVNEPANADEILSQIESEKAELADKFEDGELSAKEYQKELDALYKKERQVELNLHSAKLAKEMEYQQQRNAFLDEVKRFTDGTLYKEGTSAWSALDAAVREIASKPESESMSHRELIEAAHKKVLEDPIMNLAFSSQPVEIKTNRQPKPASKPPVSLPPTLANVPAAESNSIAEGRFAAIDHIADPEERSEAMRKLSPSERDAYLRGAA